MKESCTGNCLQKWWGLQKRNSLEDQQFAGSSLEASTSLGSRVVSCSSVSASSRVVSSPSRTSTPGKPDMSLLQDISTIRSWISKQAHLPQDIDDHLIERFLACCDGSLEKTKATMDHFFCLRAEAPEFFTDRDPTQPRMQEIFKLIDVIPLPQLTPEGYKCFLYRLADPDPEKFIFNDYVKNFFLVGDTRVKTELLIPKGEVVIFDMKGYCLRHLTRVHLISLRKYMQYTQEAHPVKLKQIHVVNVSPLLDRTLTVVKPFIKAEVANMLHFHQPGSTTLHKFVPLEILPNDYGGNVGKVADLKETWVARVLKNRDWFLTNPWVANTKKLERKNHLNIMEGSFRTLTID